MAKSATQEMAAEIARIAQTRVVQVEGVQLTCYQVEGRPTLKRVKSTLGDGWCFDNLFFPTNEWFDFLHVARVAEGVGTDVVSVSTGRFDLPSPPCLGSGLCHLRSFWKRAKNIW